MDLEKATINAKTYILSLLAVVSVAVSGTVTYMTLVQASEKIEHTNVRLDKKTARNEAKLDNLENRIRTLENEHRP